MPVATDSLAVRLARSHVNSWTNKDWGSARAALSPDVQLHTSSTNPDIPVSETSGADEYIAGLENWAGSIVTGSVKEISAVGDDSYALLTLMVEADFGAGTISNPCARLYRFDDNDKLAAEHVVFFVAPYPYREQPLWL